MDITFKDISLEDLVKNYNSEKGFVFVGKGPSDEKYVEVLCKLLIDGEVTTALPEYVVKLEDGNKYIFVYPEKVRFNYPLLEELAHVGERMGEYKLYTLYWFLKQY